MTAQIALSLLLVVASGLLLGSWRRLTGIEPGFRTDGVLLTEVDVRPARIPSDRRNSTYVRIRERLRAIPGVVLAGAAWRTPFSSNASATIEVPVSNGRTEETAVVRLNEMSAGYLRAIGVRLLAGRDFGPADLPTWPESRL